MKRYLTIILCALMAVTAAFAQKKAPKRPDTYNYNQAFKALDEQRYKDAIDYFDAELANNPKNGYAYAWKAAIYTNFGMHQEALAAANKSIQLLPKKDPEFVAFARATRARTYSALDNTEAALADYKVAMDLAPEEDYIYEHINLLDGLERYAEEKADIDLLLKQRPDNAVARVYAGRYFFNIEDYTTALTHYNYAARLEPSYSSAYAFRADVYLTQEKWREASEDVVHAMQLNVDNKAWAQMNYLADKAPTHIATSLKTMRLKEPDNPYWPYCLGLVDMAQKKYKEAVNHFIKTIELYDDDNDSAIEQASYQLAMAYRTLGNYDSALASISTAIGNDSMYVAYYVERAQIYYNMGSIDLAVDDATNIVYIAPELPDAYLLRASYRLWGGYLLNAVDDLTTVITMDETNATALQYRATAYRKLGRESEALADLKAIIALPDDGAEGNKAFAHAMMGHKAEAYDYADRVFTDNADPGNLYNCACIYSLLGETERALDTLERALDQGYNQYFHIEHDHDLDNIRDRIRFHEILGKYAPEYGIQFSVPDIVDEAEEVEGKRLKTQDELMDIHPSISTITFDN